MMGGQGIAGRMVQRPTLGPDGQPTEELLGHDRGVVLEIGSPGGQAPTCLLIMREGSGLLEWWEVWNQARPVTVVEELEEGLE